jgi:L,D-transpeptidase YcbB
MNFHPCAGIVFPLVFVGLLGCGGSDADESGEAPAQSAAPARADARARIRAVLPSAKDSTVVLTLATGDTVHLSRPTIAFYRGVLRRGKPAWSEGDEVLPKGQQLLEVLGKTGQDGLDPARYRYEAASKLSQMLNGEGGKLSDELKASYLGDLDLVLTEGFNRYALDLTRGTVDPNKVGLTWRIPRAHPLEQNLLRLMVRGTPPAEMVARLRPTHPYYERLMQSLARHEAIRAAGGWATVPATKLAKGDSSAAIAELRARLKASDDANEVTLAALGEARPMVFDSALQRALRGFQERHALPDDGALGAATLRELNSPIDDRISEITLNLDRWRWLPHDLGQLFVLVNVAGFELEVVEDNRVIETMNVVVGQPGWKTPIFADTIEQIVLNPSWNVPPSIAEQEIRPAIARDPGYLERNNMVPTSDGSFRQLPGEGNALGKYKFVFPNVDNIYLHDTPAKTLFSRSERAFSHGCIRLQRPKDLANLIASKASRATPEQIAQKVASGKEQSVRLTRKVPVYIVYFTAWVDEAGTTRFYHDIYGHDERIEAEQAKPGRVTLNQ